MLLPAIVAVIEHVPPTSLTDSVVPVTEQPVDPPWLNVTAPAVVPPVVLNVAVVPNVTGFGVATATSAVWFALLSPTPRAADVTG